VREHTNLPTMVSFVRKHVAQHFRTDRPRPSPTVSEKLLDPASATAERFSKHLRAASGALGQSRTGLQRRALRAIELFWDLQVRSCKPNPLAADIVHVGEDRGDITGAAFEGRFGRRRYGCRRLGPPRGRVKMFNKHLVHAVVDQEDLGGRALDCCSAELSVNWLAIYGLTRDHGRVAHLSAWSITREETSPSPF